MMETMLSEKGMNFNALEKEIFRIGCEFATGLMEQVLTTMDNHLAKKREITREVKDEKQRETVRKLLSEKEYKIF